jgi:PIN domain nuclease of toxin-antitoxin system
MKYLLDTHTLIWFIDGDETLPGKIRNEISNIKNTCYLSIASLWEMAIKISIGKLTLQSDYHQITNFLVDNNINILPIEFTHLQTLLNLEHIHRDPFDRVIVAQAITDKITILTVDKNIVKYPVECMW